MTPNDLFGFHFGPAAISSVPKAENRKGWDSNPRYALDAQRFSKGLSGSPGRIWPLAIKPGHDHPMDNLVVGRNL
jgi:hypothetical protein